MNLRSVYVDTNMIGSHTLYRGTLDELAKSGNVLGVIKTRKLLCSDAFGIALERFCLLLTSVAQIKWKTGRVYSKAGFLQAPALSRTVYVTPSQDAGTPECFSGSILTLSV